MSASKFFAYTRANLIKASKMRGVPKKRFLEEVEFMRTHIFKPMPRPGNRRFGIWVKRRTPIKKIRIGR